MEQGEFLTSAEVKALTGRARATGQVAWLAERDIPHQLDGRRVILCRAHSRAWVEGKPQAVTSWQPDFSKPF